MGILQYGNEADGWDLWCRNGTGSIARILYSMGPRSKFLTYFPRAARPRGPVRVTSAVDGGRLPMIRWRRNRFQCNALAFSRSAVYGTGSISARDREATTARQSSAFARIATAFANKFLHRPVNVAALVLGSDALAMFGVET